MADPSGYEFSVLVFDMAHRGEPDGEHIVPGFGTLAEARAYAEARVRSSVEELRKPGISPADLRTLWYLYGEDCKVLGDDGGRTDVDLYIAVPATQAECDWPAMTPWLRRFHVAVLIANASGERVWAGGFINRYQRPSSEVLLRIFARDARETFVRKNIADAEPAEVSVASLFELPLPPQPGETDGRPPRRWRVDVDFVCHDIKFGAVGKGVFLWPEQPSGFALDAMVRVLLSDTLALRGDGPDCADYCDIIGATVVETAAEPDHPQRLVETPFSS